MFDYHLLDMVEFNVENFVSVSDMDVGFSMSAIIFIILNYLGFWSSNRSKAINNSSGIFVRIIS